MQSKASKRVSGRLVIDSGSCLAFYFFFFFVTLDLESIKETRAWFSA